MELGAQSGIMWVGKVLVFMMIMMGLCARGDDELQVGFYSTSCPGLQNIVFKGMRQAGAQERRIAASILRLFFHDCIVQGCDASILLDDTPDFQGEKSAEANLNSLRGFEVIDNIKASVENACPETVSCADILALAARDGISLRGGPSWEVALGRRDATSAGLNEANALPSPFSDFNELLSSFTTLGFTMRDLVTLSGAHTFGGARCKAFKDRLYNMTGDGTPDTTMNRNYLKVLQGRCPQSGGDENLLMLDPFTPFYFDNRYYANLVSGRGLLASDQILFSSVSTSIGGPSAQQIIRAYSQNPRLFFRNFASSMIKLGSLHPLTGSQGEIRRDCHFVN